MVAHPVYFIKLHYLLLCLVRDSAAVGSKLRPNCEDSGIVNRQKTLPT